MTTAEVDLDTTCAETPSTPTKGGPREVARTVDDLKREENNHATEPAQSRYRAT